MMDCFYIGSENPARGMAERTGLEPATTGVTGRYSNQLNYRSAVRAAYSIRLHRSVKDKGLTLPLPVTLFYTVTQAV